MLVNPFKRLDNLTVSLVFYSEPGCGKTHMMFDSKFRWFIFNTELEQSLVTLDNVVSLSDYYNPSMTMWTVNTVSDLKDGFKYLKDHIDEYDGVCFDHLTDYQTVKKRQFIKNGKDRETPYITIQEWGMLADATAGVVEMLAKLPIHGVFMTHEKAEEDKEKGSRHYSGKLSGSTSSTIMGKCNAAGRMFIKEEKDDDGNITVHRGIRFGRTTRIQAKQHGKLKAIEGANIDFIICKMLGDIPTDTMLDEFKKMWHKIPRLKEADNKVKLFLEKQQLEEEKIRAKEAKEKKIKEAKNNKEAK